MTASAAWRLALCSAAAILIVVLWKFDPAAASFYPPCVFRRITGLLCPGCGSARAIHALLHLDVPAAIRVNPLIVVLALAAGIRATASVLLLKPFAAEIQLQGSSPVIVLVVILAFWILRNIVFV